MMFWRKETLKHLGSKENSILKIFYLPLKMLFMSWERIFNKYIKFFVVKKYENFKNFKYLLGMVSKVEYQ